MFATATTHKGPLVSALEGLRAFRLSAALGLGGARAANREGEADLGRMSLHALDELGLLSGEGCVTDWGLVERAARLRSGWA